NAETLWKLKGGKLYTEGRITQVLAGSPPFRAGDVAAVLGVAGPARTPGEPGEPGGYGPSQPPPDPHLRTAAQPLGLRDLGAGEKDAYATEPAGHEVTLIELGDPDNRGLQTWAYVHWAEGDGVYGWVPAGELTGQPNGDVVYRVRAVPAPHR